MKIAYIILAHKLPGQLIRLVEKINTPYSEFFIHIDKKTHINIFQNVQNQLHRHENVHFLKRYRYNWGEFGSIKATMEGIKTVLNQPVQPDYVMLLTGQDYPIKSNQAIKNFLENSNGKSYIHYFSSPHPLAKKWEERIIYWHFFTKKWHLVFPKQDMFYRQTTNDIWNLISKHCAWQRTLPENLKPFFGSAYWCLSRDCINFVNNYIKQHKRYINFFRLSYMPDEIFFQTMLLNSRYAKSLVNDDLHYKDFSQHKSHPKILTSNDLGKFINSSNLFARKFDQTVDSSVLDMIDKIIG